MVPIRNAILTLGLILISVALCGTLRKEFQALERAWEQGRINEAASQIASLKPKSDNEKALLQFITACLNPDRESCLFGYQSAIDQYPNTHYGQMSMLYRAKIHILEREHAQAKQLLNRINSAKIPQRFYWLAVCAEQIDDYAATITNAESYLRLEPRGQYSEECQYLITHAYLGQNKTQSAISTLNKLNAQSGYPTDRQYFHYLLGTAYQKAGNWQEALSQFKTGIEISRYSQLAYQMEDRLFELKQSHGSKVNLSFLFPYTDLHIAVEDTQVNQPLPPPVLQNTQPADTPLRSSTKPSSGLYVQTGRFGVEANARSIAYRIRQLKLPAGYYEDKSNKSVPWVSFCGPFANTEEQKSAMAYLKENNIDCFATRY
ncbi:MAG: hypothetical protein GX122_08190 [Candidatus Cloacimonetes bacterium]|nr:SPOR domain-containing protein [Candidatus Cloacimonadota bacterium]NLO12381.1 hypothetical protein [Candidatus Cloacimonadota bacterium]